MTREELDAALGRLPVISGTATDRHSIPADRLLILVTAARERLAQLPELCMTCLGPGHSLSDVTDICPTCHGSGKVYPAELVERIAAVLDLTSHAEQYAVAVLDALNGETE